MLALAGATLPAFPLAAQNAAQNTAQNTAPAPSALAESGTGEFALHDGDRVVFYGDSITAQRLYTQDVENAVRTRYPHLHLSFWNAGVNGDTVTGGGTGGTDRRLERDVFPQQPTVVTIMLGMNDGNYQTGDYALPAYEQGYRLLVRKLKARLPGVRLYLIQPSPYDEVAHPPGVAGYNGVLQRFGRIVQQIAQEEGAQVIDANAPVLAALRTARALDPVQAAQLIPDRIHPAASGHWLLAETILKAWAFDPVVSRVRIDAATLTPRLTATTVSELAHEDPAYVWTQVDRSLPLPLNPADPGTAFLLKISDLARLDQQDLNFTGLRPGVYKLSIDDTAVGLFSAAQLAAGINLSLEATPMSAQSLAYAAAMDRRVLTDLVRFDLLTNGVRTKDHDAGVQALEELNEQRLGEATGMLFPQPHSYRLVRQQP